MKPPVLLITGGAGFLGRVIVQEFLAEDSPLVPKEIRVFDLVPYPGNEDKRVVGIQGDIRNYDALLAACRGVNLVIHAAAIVDWGTHSEEEVYGTNAEGTANVIQACREAGVGYLVYTSSLDTIFSGEPRVNIDETLPIPEAPYNMYCHSKSMGEKMVLEANGESLKTCALRPSDIYGEQDPYHMGSLLGMVKMGVYVRLGDGSARCQFVYVGNMAHAHVAAAHALMNGNEQVAGQVYFITDGPGQNFFAFFERIISAAGYRMWLPDLSLPRGLAYAMASFSEGMARVLRPFVSYHPSLSRFAVTYTCTDMVFSAGRAARDFGWQPKYSEREALERTIAYYQKEK